MKGDKIKYYDRGSFYVLAETYTCFIGVFPDRNIASDYVSLTKDGRITLQKGYAWDGPSGPTIDTKSSLRGSLIHDGCYQLARNKLLSTQWKDKADRILMDICIEDGMWEWRAKLWYKGVRDFAMDAYKNVKYEKIMIAP